MVKKYTPDTIRNVVFTGHGCVGKTSIAEGILYATGHHDRLGQVTEGNTLLDYFPDEIERQSSINMALAHCDWKGNKINIIDTPGYSDFYGETVAGMHVADGAVIFMNAAAGVEVGTESVWKFASNLKLPVLLVVNGIDKDNVNLDDVVATAGKSFGKKVIPIQAPYGTGADFKGIVDLFSQKLMVFSTELDGTYEEKPLPGDLDFSLEREQMIELIAETDDRLLEKFFEGKAFSTVELKGTLRKAVVDGKVLPLLYSVALQNVGTTPLLDAIVDYMPAPADRPLNLSDGTTLKQDPHGPLAAIIFKTISEPHVGELSYMRVYSGIITHGADAHNSTRNITERVGQIYAVNGKKREDMHDLVAGDIGALVKLKSTKTNNVFSDKHHPFDIKKIVFLEPVTNLAIIPKKKGDEDKIGVALHHLEDEDQSFGVTHDAELHQTIIRGLSEIHLEVLVHRLKSRYGVEVDVISPKVPYRETIRGAAAKSYRHKKQSGGSGQFGEVHLHVDAYHQDAPIPSQYTFRHEEIDDLPWGGKLQFVNCIVGGAIDNKFIPAVKRGVLECMQRGAFAGYPIIDVRVIVYDGKMHPVDSNDNAFKTAGRMSFKESFLAAKPTMLEPIYEIHVTVPDEYMGDVLGDLSSRRGKIQGMDPQEGYEIIHALVPLAELDRYSTSLRSITQGRGLHTRRFLHYEEVPREISEKLKQTVEEDKE